MTVPAVCPNCQQPIPKNATSCPACGELPDPGQEHTGGSGA